MKKGARQETGECCVTNVAADAAPSVEGECEQVRKSARMDNVCDATSRVEVEELAGVMVSCSGGGADAASSGPVESMMNDGVAMAAGGESQGPPGLFAGVGAVTIGGAGSESFWARKHRRRKEAKRQQKSLPGLS